MYENAFCLEALSTPSKRYTWPIAGSRRTSKPPAAASDGAVTCRLAAVQVQGTTGTLRSGPSYCSLAVPPMMMPTCHGILQVVASHLIVVAPSQSWAETSNGENQESQVEILAFLRNWPFGRRPTAKDGNGNFGNERPTFCSGFGCSHRANPAVLRLM